MDIINGDINKIYFKYLATSFFSSFVVSVYSMVDAMMIGRYEGPMGTAATAAMSPVWTMFMSIGILFGMGGSVLYANMKGKGDEKQANQYFTASTIGALFVTLIIWLVIIFFDRELMYFFGADDSMMPICRAYLGYLKGSIPFFVMAQFLSTFIRNDGNPVLASASIIIGGVMNMIGDYYCVFVLDMGAAGAGLATAVSQIVSFVILLIHFVLPVNTLKFIKTKALYLKNIEAIKIGFSVFIVDVSWGVFTLIFNRQLMKYLNAEAMAIFGVVLNVIMFVQCASYSVGQAAQPIISVNYGAKNADRVFITKKLCVAVSFVLGVVCFAISCLIPQQIIGLFMDASPRLIATGSKYMRMYFISFLFMNYNIFVTYYFQSVLMPGLSTFVSLLRGVVISSIMAFVLPAVFGPVAIWFAMPITDFVVLIISFLLVKKSDDVVIHAL